MLHGDVCDILDNATIERCAQEVEKFAEQCHSRYAITKLEEAVIKIRQLKSS